MQGSLFVTTNSYLHGVFNIEDTLATWLRVMAVKMKEKLDKYWRNMMLLIAMLLDS